jgi:hypothetical protein
MHPYLHKKIYSCKKWVLQILSISDIFHLKTSRVSQRKVMSMNSYLGSRLSLIQSFLSGLLASTTTSFSSILQSESI